MYLLKAGFKTKIQILICNSIQFFYLIKIKEYNIQYAFEFLRNVETLFHSKSSLSTPRMVRVVDSSTVCLCRRDLPQTSGVKPALEGLMLLNQDSDL